MRGRERSESKDDSNGVMCVGQQSHIQVSSKHAACRAKQVHEVFNARYRGYAAQYNRHYIAVC